MNIPKIVLMIGLQGYTHGLVPESTQTKKIGHFYECVATLMSYQLQCLCLNSIEDFTSFIMDIGVSNIVRLSE